ncbi:MAG: BREX-4 system phosphatase PglZ [Prevotella sp.]|nr:BREX-4 system phosphatase PglZ [Staphylococcus sp.]MCM1350101.1 BREX-4 system phosphatase PglZ [Prevotella sp.]
MSYVDELLKLIIKDKKMSNTYDRYPIRFLFTRLSSETYNDISELIKKISTFKEKNHFNQLEVIKLSDYLNYNDAWLTKNAIYNIINNLDSNKDYIILGFSELARFYSKSDLQSLIISFMTDIESLSQSNKQRIYLVCFSLYDKLLEVLKINGRNENINPVIAHDSFVDSDSICVYYANSNFEFNSLNNKIFNSSQWLSLYEQKDIEYDKGIVCLSDTLVSIYEKAKPDNFVEIYKIDSYFSMLVRMKGLNLTNKEESLFNDDFWKKIYELTEKSSLYNIKQIVLSYLKVQSIYSDCFIELFVKTDDFGKRLMMLYLVENENELQYSYYLKELLYNSYDNFFTTILNDIINYFDILKDDLYFEARKYFINKLLDLKLINRFFSQDDFLVSLNKMMNSYISNKILSSNLEDENILDIEVEKFIIKYKQDANYVKKVFNSFFKDYLVKLIIGRFEIEQYVIMNFIQNNFISIEEAIEVYPDLRNYYGFKINSYIEYSKQWISEYIYNYKESKILGKGTPKFLEFSKRNTEQFMYNWYTNSELGHLHDLIKNKYFDILIVLDGVGIEYFDFIIQIIKEKNKYINYANFGKAFLPSITSVNKSKFNFFDKWIIDFDKEIIHGSIYNSKKSIPDSLDYLRNIIEKIINDNPNHVICITADHGCTCQSKLLDYNKKYSFSGVDHEGRCMEIKNMDNNISKSDDYFIFDSISDNKKFIISLNNISLNDKPVRESHGGATLEECFIPCIIFSDKEENQNYNIYPIKAVINGLDREVKVEITPKPLLTPVYTDNFGNQDTFTNVNNNIWVAKLKVVTNQMLKVSIGSFSDIINIRSSSGITKKGDDGFDD